MPHVEAGIVEVQQWQHFRRPVARTKGGVYLLDHPYWISQAGRTIRVRIINADQFAEVVEGEQIDPPPNRDQRPQVVNGPDPPLRSANDLTKHTFD